MVQPAHVRLKGPRRRRIVSQAALAASLTVIAVVTLLPEQSASEIRLWPFSELSEAVLGPDVRLLLETVANVLLFMPFGAALRLRGVGVAEAVLFGLLLSTIVEGTQLLLVSGRTTSTDDLLLNMFGAAVGNALASHWTR
jgi:glycopeptide antibiotics resistance protein